jgi:hypothetical protein
MAADRRLDLLLSGGGVGGGERTRCRFSQPSSCLFFGNVTCLLLALIHHWKSPHRLITMAECHCLGRHIADTALHILMVRY